MNDGFDENSQIFSGLPGLVPFKADAKSCRASVIEGNLKHELLLPVLQNHATHARQLIFLEGAKKEKDAADQVRCINDVRRRLKDWVTEFILLEVNSLQKLI